MQLNMIQSIYGKEMLDMIRDRRTMISMIIVPVIVLPVLMTAGLRLVGVLAKKSEQDARNMSVAVRASNPGIAEALRKSGLTLSATADLRAAVEKKAALAAVEEVPSATGGTPTIRVYMDASNPSSAMIGERIRAALTELKDQQVREHLRNSGIPLSVLDPFSIDRVNVAPARKMAGMIWGTMLGYMLLLMMFSGGMYPVIDMTAGEKERKTLETFLTTPVSRSDIVLGKIFAAMTAIFLTAVLTLGSLIAAIQLNRTKMKSPEVSMMLNTIPLDGHTIALIVLTLAPLCVLAASVMMAIAMFARGFKEAQSYLTPLILFIIFPAMLGGIPGLELTPALCLVPIFNASQIIRGIMLGEFSNTAFLITLAVNVGYAAIAFYIAKSRFEDESVLFRS